MDIKIFTDRPNYFNWIPNSNRVDSLKKANLLLLSGGEDVHPSLYGEDVGKFTQSNINRDIKELELFKRAVDTKTPILGICRGAQALSIFNGGKLIQHVNNHAISTTHTIKTNEEEVYAITSTHHQMMFPFSMDEKDYRIIAYSSPTRGTTYLNGKNEQIECPIFNVPLIKSPAFVEPEIVYFPKSNSLGIQGHPEFYNCPQETRNYLIKLIKHYLFNEIN